MSDKDISLIAHLMRRAGFGASRDELESLAARGYDAVADDLVHPERSEDVDEALVSRYYRTSTGKDHWLYRMINSRRPLQEKMTLFWHHVFATGFSKINHNVVSDAQITTFRRIAMSDIKTILAELSRDAAMLFWLDNNENHKADPNENYGRELLELFSMGAGNYTELDLKMASRAFTGWTFQQPIPLYPHGNYPAEFDFREDDHDAGDKSFLGHSGPFNGEDIVDIIVKQPATARFISRHLYTFFVADEPPVALWRTSPPRDPEAIETLVDAYFESEGDVPRMLEALFTSDFFKEAQFQRVKSPTELVTGIMKLSGVHKSPEPGIAAYVSAAGLMGQALMDPPTVEGWHTGREWINGGTLNERVNFAVNELSDPGKPGVQAIIDRLAGNGASLTPEELVDRCLDLAGPVPVEESTREALLAYARSGGELRLAAESGRDEGTARVAHLLQMIVATREYQFG